jgi:hypothetical protein
VDRGTNAAHANNANSSRYRGFAVVLWPILLAIVLMVIACGITDSLHQEDRGPVRPTNDFLRVSNRDRLEICVQPAAGAVVDASSVRAKVDGGLRDLSASPRWSQQGLGRGVPFVEVGCSAQPVVLQPGVVVTKAVTSTRHIPEIPHVHRPSRYALILFVLPDEKISDLFFGIPPQYWRETEERWCTGGEVPKTRREKVSRCDGVTTGLYLSEAEVEVDQIVTATLGQALGVSESPAPADPSRRPPHDGPVVKPSAD